MARELAATKGALGTDGELIDGDASAPERILRHAFREIEGGRLAAARREVDDLAHRLDEILRADRMAAPEARRPEALRSSVGPGFAREFDFAALSKMLARSPGVPALDASRRSRIELALAVLRAQRFFGAGAGEWVFARGGDALAAFRERLPEMARFMKAVCVARLEVGGDYRPEIHDPWFASFDETSLGAAEIAQFPSYLVVLDDAADVGGVLDLLLSGLPIKVLAQVRDAFAGAGAHLARMALGLGEAFVLQAPMAGLPEMMEEIRRGIEFPGPALLSVLTGDNGHAPALSPFLLSAAARDARLFPSFVNDPGAGGDQASRFRLPGNPQAERPWPVSKLTFEDSDLQISTEEVAFTAADLATADDRFAAHFHPVAKSAWSEAMAPLSAGGAAPYAWVVEDGNRLVRALSEPALLDLNRRVARAWRDLQEMAGIDNSHARRLLEKERAVWEAERAAAAATSAAPAPAPAESAPAAPAPVTPAAEAPKSPARAPGEPWIDTKKCSSCNECTKLNPKMFVYDENKQAKIADPKAGTYRQLVEAAEKCQMAVIHPGLPLNPAEPDLEALIARAAPFNK
jgi:ferredoxin